MVNQLLANVDPAYVWGDLLPILQRTDLNMVNLETTLTRSTEQVPKVFNFKTDPENVAVLKKGHIDVVNLANNHILDFAVAGLQETLATLDHAGIAHVGAGMDAAQAAAPAIIERNGIRLGILGFTDNESGWQATEQRPGVAYVRVGNIAPIQKAIDAIKDSVDVVIVSLHWGPNMRERPTEEFVQFAHSIIDAGASIIHGHSAHIFQGVELYNGGLIMYDTGDLVDDYAVDPVLHNDRSFFFLVTVGKNGVQAMQLIPTMIGEMQVNKASDSVAAWSMARMQTLCAPFDTQFAQDGYLML